MISSFKRYITYSPRAIRNVWMKKLFGNNKADWGSEFHTLIAIWSCMKKKTHLCEPEVSHIYSSLVNVCDNYYCGRCWVEQHIIAPESGLQSLLALILPYKLIGPMHVLYRYHDSIQMPSSKRYNHTISRIKLWIVTIYTENQRSIILYINNVQILMTSWQIQLCYYH